MRNYLFFILVFLSLPSFATLFQPIDVKKHLLESDGIIEGVVDEIETIEDINGKLITRVTLVPDKWIGDYELNSNKVSVFYPGGELGSKVRKIMGAPKFELGENVVVLTKIFQDAAWVSNLGLGKYTLTRVSDKKIMVNQVFPLNKKMGVLKLADFYQLAKEVKGEKFSYRFKEKYELYSEGPVKKKVHTKKGRSIASVAETKDTDSENQSSSLWLVFALGLLGIAFKVVRNKIS